MKPRWKAGADERILNEFLEQCVLCGEAGKVENVREEAFISAKPLTFAVCCAVSVG